VCRLTLSSQGDVQARLERQRDHWLTQIETALSLANKRVADLNAEVVKSPEAALELARQGLKSLRTQADNLQEAYRELQTAVKAAPRPVPLTEGVKGLAELEQRHKELEG